MQSCLHRAIAMVEADRILALALVDRLVTEKLLSGAELEIDTSKAVVFDSAGATLDMTLSSAAKNQR